MKVILFQQERKGFEMSKDELEIIALVAMLNHETMMAALEDRARTMMGSSPATEGLSNTYLELQEKLKAWRQRKGRQRH